MEDFYIIKDNGVTYHCKNKIDAQMTSMMIDLIKRLSDEEKQHCLMLYKEYCLEQNLTKIKKA